MVRQPRRRSFGGGTAPTGRAPEHYEGLNSESVEDEDDIPLATDPPPLIPTQSVRDLFRNAAAARQQAKQNESDGEEDQSPADRLKTVTKTDPTYAKEYRLRLIHRLLMRNIALDQIAAQLEVSVKTVQRDRAEISRRLKREAAKIDVNGLLGETMSFYKEHSAMALRIATSLKTPIGARLAALRTSMQSRKEMGQWLSVAGVFEVLKFRAQEGTANADITKLVQIAENLMGDDQDLGDLSMVEEDDQDIELFL